MREWTDIAADAWAMNPKAKQKTMNWPPPAEMLD